MDLPSEHLRAAIDCIAAWRRDPLMARACPVCGTEGIEIIDRSARPHSEWYVLRCGACGLDATMHIPMPGPAV